MIDRTGEGRLVLVSVLEVQSGSTAVIPPTVVANLLTGAFGSLLIDKVSIPACSEPHNFGNMSKHRRIGNLLDITFLFCNC